jgi:hypothetical protein
MHKALPSALLLCACYGVEQPKARAEVHADHMQYYRCMKKAANRADEGVVPPKLIVEQAKSQCTSERQTLTVELIAEITERRDLTCKDELAKVPCMLRDSYERRFAKNIHDEIARKRGLPVEPELMY